MHKQLVLPFLRTFQGMLSRKERGHLRLRSVDGAMTLAEAG